MKARAPQRLFFLDLLRGIAVILVIAGHMLDAGITEGESLQRIFGKQIMGTVPILSYFNPTVLYILRFFGSAGTGVTLFFLITGYIIPYSYQKYNTNLQFMIGRFFRLIPPAFIIMNIVYITLSYYYNIPYDFIQISKNFLKGIGISYKSDTVIMLHAFEPFWTLAIEILFYFFVIYMRNSLNFYSTISAQAFLLFLFSYTEKSSVLWLYYILVGTCILCIEQELDYKNKLNNVIKILTTCTMFIIFLLINRKCHLYPSRAFIWGLVIFILVRKIETIKVYDNFPRFKKFATFFADISYPLYLINVPIGMGLSLYAKIHWNIENPYLQTFIGFALSIILSYICHILFEKPSHNIGRYITKSTNSNRLIKYVRGQDNISYRKIVD